MIPAITAPAAMVRAAFAAPRGIANLNAGDIGSLAAAFATIVLTFLTYFSLRESRRQSRLTIRREHLRGLQSGPLDELLVQFRRFYGPLFDGNLVLPFSAPRDQSEPGQASRFAPELLLLDEIFNHLPELRNSIEELSAEYNAAAEALLAGLRRRIRELFADFGRQYPHRGRWEAELFNFCAPLVVVAVAGLQGHSHEVVRRQPDSWHLIANSSAASLDIDLGPEKDSGEPLWAIVRTALDDPLGQARAAIEGLRSRCDACNVQFARAAAAQTLRGNCDLAPTE